MFRFVKLKNKAMKTNSFLSVLVAIFLSSCTTVYYTQSYEDANYLTQDEFSDYEDYATDDSEYEDNEIVSDTSEDGSVVNNYYGDYYEADDYYDFSYSARIRRFHRPVWSVGYYGGLYTDYYWYSNNPYHCGTSIYFGYNYYDPFYSPYYSWGYSSYYSPNYSYYNHHGYGHNHHYGYNNNYNDVYTYSNSYDNNSIHYGPRGSMSSRGNTNRGVKAVVNSSNNKNSTYNKFDRVVDKKITTRTIINNSTKGVKTNTNRSVVKTNTTKPSTNKGVKTNTHKSNRSNTKSNSYNKGNTKSNRNYSQPKSNSNRSYKSNSRGSSTRGSNRSSGNNKSSGSSRSSGNRKSNPRK